MYGYIGTSKRDIEYLIESIQEPGISVRREKRLKPVCSLMQGPNVVYHFSKGGQRLFSVCVCPASDELSVLEISIKCGDAFSDTLREGDDGYRKACVLYQLAEKMYCLQHQAKQVQRQSTQIRLKTLGNVCVNTK